MRCSSQHHALVRSIVRGSGRGRPLGLVAEQPRRDDAPRGNAEYVRTSTHELFDVDRLLQTLPELEVGEGPTMPVQRKAVVSEPGCRAVALRQHRVVAQHLTVRPRYPPDQVV